jgi:hypothetical protein
MTLPAKIRVNTLVNFPALVTGSAPVTIGKANGIWTIGLAVGTLATSVPPMSAFTTDYVLLWDDVLKTYSKVSLATLSASIAPPPATRAQRTTTVTPIVVASSDQIISCKITSPASCALPSAASRIGVPVTFKDLGQATVNNITLTANGTDTIDGLPSYVLRNNFAGVTLVPFNDGTNVGWMVQ